MKAWRTQVMSNYHLYLAIMIVTGPLHMQDIAGECGVTAMPTFQIFRQGRKVEEVRGADVKALTALLEKYNGMGGAFSGQGRTLAGGEFATPDTNAHQWVN